MKVKDDNNDALALTIAEAARRTMVSEKTIRRSVWDGSLPSYRIGRRIVIKIEDLVVWVFANPNAPKSPPALTSAAPRIEVSDLARRRDSRKVRAATPAPRGKTKNAPYAEKQTQPRRGHLNP